MIYNENELIGLKVKNYKQVDEYNVLLETERGELKIYTSGDCCAVCFFQHIEGLDNFIDSQILEINHKEWIVQNVESIQGQIEEILGIDDGNVVERGITTIKTTKGYVDFEMRLEHNGYYGGSLNFNWE